MAGLETTADFESPADDWARGVFDRVRTGQHEPPWTPDATAAARLSGRRRTRFRAAGALAAAAVVGLSVTAFDTLGGNVFKGRNAVSPGASQTVWTGLDLTGYLDISGVWKSMSRGGAGPMSATGLTTISTVLQRLDPGLAHIRTTTGRHRLDTGPDAGGTTNIQLRAQGFWAPKGDVSSFPPPGGTFIPKTPFGYVAIVPMNPEFLQRPGLPNMPCGLGALAGSDQIPAVTSWSTCVHAQQTDGSDITVTHSVGLPAGTVTVAARVFRDGSSVQLVASTVIGRQDMTATGPAMASKFQAGPSLDPAPWTDISLAQALAGPDVKGLP